MITSFFICNSFQPWSMVAIFYSFMVAICVLGQTAIFIKKFFEYYKERQAQKNVNVMIRQNNQQPANNAINNAHWNHQERKHHDDTHRSLSGF